MWRREILTRLRLFLFEICMGSVRRVCATQCVHYIAAVALFHCETSGFRWFNKFYYNGQCSRFSKRPECEELIDSVRVASSRCHLIKSPSGLVC